MSNSCEIQWLGQLDYRQALGIQKELVVKRLSDEVPDTLLLLEHPRTYTIGVDCHREQLLVSEQEMARLNIACIRVNRGGAIFFHCPGQLVVYPILKLDGICHTYHDYISLLERVIIRALGFLKVRAFRQQGQPGILVFSGSSSPHDIHGHADSPVAKIGSIGVRVDRDNITSHGFWINVNPSLQFFDFIVPAGVKDCRITSLQHILNRPVEIGTVVEPVIQSFCEIFEMIPVLSGDIGHNGPGRGPGCTDMKPDDRFDRSQDYYRRKWSTQSQT